jgi:tripartite-type tricarboxylate transporter receptor subunit TctC
VFVVKNELPAKTIQEVISLAKAKPGELNYGSTGIGSGSHLSTELFMARTGIKMTQVPYRGAPPLVQDLVDRAFGGSAAQLVLRALSADGATDAELKQIRKLIDDYREKR